MTNSDDNATPIRRELRYADLCRMFNTTRQTINRWYREPKYKNFPSPHESGPGRVAWWEDEILEWAKHRDENSTPPELPPVHRRGDRHGSTESP